MREIKVREGTDEVIQYPEDMYCVYVHRDPETLDVVYVGKGTLHRAFQIVNRGYDHHKWLLSKLEEFEIQEIVNIKGGNMTESEALVVEAHEIKCCLRFGCNLFNVTYNPYRRTRRKISGSDNILLDEQNRDCTTKMGNKISKRTRDKNTEASV